MRGPRPHAEIARRAALEPQRGRRAEIDRHRIELVAPRGQRTFVAQALCNVGERGGTGLAAAQPGNEVDGVAVDGKHVRPEACQPLGTRVVDAAERYAIDDEGAVAHRGSRERAVKPFVDCS